MTDFLLTIAYSLLLFAFYCYGYQHGTRKMEDFAIESFKEIQEEIKKK